MDAIGNYLLRILTTALICGILVRITGDKGLLTEIVKLLAGVCMAITVLSPWVNIRLENMQDIALDFTVDAETAAEEGKNSAREAISDIIKSQTETYILDKAASLGITVTVEVQLTEDAVPYPAFVTLRGPVSPYVKSVLSNYISENLGIGMEEQKWIG